LQRHLFPLFPINLLDMYTHTDAKGVLTSALLEMVKSIFQIFYSA
jgi:hypothetical protein